jgi:hypothetical protein
MAPQDVAVDAHHHVSNTVRTKSLPLPASYPQALPLILDQLLDPLTSVLLSVTAVLMFGEILPQAVCSK